MRSTTAFLIAAIYLAGGFGTLASADDTRLTIVTLIGLADATAILVINGSKPRMLRVGQTRAGVRLISVRNDLAIVEVDGERRELPLGGQVYSPPKSGAGSSVTLSPNGNGHYVTRGSINGASVRFLVDTGASMVSMDASHARSAGIAYLEGRKTLASTANGVAEVYVVKLDSVQVGNILLTNIDGVVHANTDLPVVLLGMSFLNQLDMRRENDNLTLKRRY
jgi:aspartyl protease family protein